MSTQPDPAAWPIPAGFEFVSTAAPESSKPPTLAEALALAEQIRAAFAVERTSLVQVVTAAARAAGLTVLYVEPVEQIAAQPEIVQQLAGLFPPAAPDPLALGRIGSLTDLPVIVDESLPPGEVHLRPHLRPAGGAS